MASVEDGEMDAARSDTGQCAVVVVLMAGIVERPALICLSTTTHRIPRYPSRMHYDAHQPVIDDLEARILTIRDSL